MEAVISDIGAELSFEDFYEREHDRVFRAVMAFCGDREVAKDATQEGFARAYGRWRRLRNKNWATGWVMTTAMNHSRRTLRRKPIPQVQNAESPAPSGDRVDLVRALVLLPQRQRQAVILFHIADQPIAVVAELMGISDGAVKTHLDRARKSLRTPLEVKHV